MKYPNLIAQLSCITMLTIALLATSGQAATVIPVDFDETIVDNDLDGEGEGFINEGRVAHASPGADNTQGFFMGFELTAAERAEMLATGAEITLRVYLEAIFGTPEGNVDLNGLNNNTSAAIDFADYEDSSETLVSDAFTPSSTTGQYYDFDVTSFVVDELTASASNIPKFALEMDNPHPAPADGFWSYQLQHIPDANPAELVVEVIPTPAALPAGLALLGLAAMRRQRSR